MADENEEFDQQGFAPRNRVEEIGQAIAEAAALLASGAILRAQEIIALADDLGNFETDVDSSFIESLGYNLTTQVVTARFRDGSIYRWPNIGIGDFLRWFNASSKGQFFNSEVRGRWAPLAHLSEGTKGAKR
jgi:KTSC domain